MSDAYDEAGWINRISYRADLTSRLTHLTRGCNEEEAFNKLCKILRDKRLISQGKSSYVIDGAKVVCFQDIPLVSVAENLKVEQMRGEANKRYSAFGIRMNKGSLYQNFKARPVMYGSKDELMAILPKDQYWRIVSMDYKVSYDIKDWSHEREWRVPGDVTFEYSDIEIIVSSAAFFKRIIKFAKNEKTSILDEINGIITLDSMYK